VVRPYRTLHLTSQHALAYKKLKSYFSNKTKFE
jgi:hypothetical protein